MIASESTRLHPALSTPPSDIVLCTLNARHAHASLALRYLQANLGALQPRSVIVEFVIGARTETLVEKLLAHRPRIVALSVYIWNVDETTRLVAVLKRVAPEVKVILGGPEVSHEYDQQRIVQLADHLVTGPGELAFTRLCGQLLDGPAPLMKVIAGDAPDLDRLCLPYSLYSDRDIAERFLYVEASRGCPFKCEFCLSSLDKTAWAFDTDRLLAELAALHARGARRFKFIDRTFNLKIDASRAILQFFLGLIESTPDDPVFAHFELVPDHLPDRLRDVIARFPAGTLQFEIGIQTWNPQVQALISRRQDNDKASDNIRWLAGHGTAHLHVDLIAGLPGEDLDSFATGFDRLAALGPHEIQVGVLKRLRGTPITRHTETFGMRYNPDPPYNVLSTDRVPFQHMQRITRFARYWDLIANSGRFVHALPLLLSTQPFGRFMALSDWLYAHTDATHRFSSERLFELVQRWAIEAQVSEVQAITDSIAKDRQAAHPAPRAPDPPNGAHRRAHAAPARQARFLRGAQLPRQVD